MSLRSMIPSPILSRRSSVGSITIASRPQELCRSKVEWLACWLMSLGDALKSSRTLPTMSSDYRFVGSGSMMSSLRGSMASLLRRIAAGFSPKVSGRLASCLFRTRIASAAQRFGSTHSSIASQVREFLPSRWPSPRAFMPWRMGSAPCSTKRGSAVDGSVTLIALCIVKLSRERVSTSWPVMFSKSIFRSVCSAPSAVLRASWCFDCARSTPLPLPVISIWAIPKSSAHRQSDSFKCAIDGSKPDRSKGHGVGRAIASKTHD